MITWSYGGGIQSVAIGVLIREGALPKPDLAVIADTGREKRTTWQYMNEVMQPYLDPIGLKIEIASHDLAREDLYRNNLTIIPAYTQEGRLGSFCSMEWKRDVIYRWLRQQSVKATVMWIGFSMDEIRRVPERDRRAWCQLEFPLIDKFINRAMCQRLITAAGLPLPLKSRCWACPHQNAEEWAEVLADPIDAELAIALDEEIRASDPRGEGLWLHSSRKPLKMVQAGDGMDTPARPCESGICWT